MSRIWPPRPYPPFPNVVLKSGGVRRAAIGYVSEYVKKAPW